MSDSSPDDELPAFPQPSPAWFLRWFTGVARRRIRSSFHEVRLSKTSAIPDSDSAVVLYGNHPSWWDPLVGLIIRDVRFPERMPFTPIDAEMLHQYG
ncbi:MAG: hypothetical protein AAGJ31_09840, partial [Verrucomicrobiota bacterium]